MERAACPSVTIAQRHKHMEAIIHIKKRRRKYAEKSFMPEA